ncbi:ubiquinone biosynthesis O-methyltransferase isoform X2 [Monomorium pharaonis]|nr:ubiquinone biosynthesis O-methyltransferase isoform X2 [Monomorium pharaonis]
MQLCLKTNMITLNIGHFYGSWKILERRLLKNIINVNKITRSKSTKNPNKVDFSKWKDSWWDEDNPKHLLHLYNPLRVKFIKDGLANAGFKMQNSNFPLEGIKIMDVGCGGGILTESLAKLGAQVTGIDPSAELIDVAKEHVKLNSNISQRINYLQTTAEDFVQKERETYDAVITCEVLQYVPDPQLFLKECAKMVKPGKSIFVMTINKTFTSWLSAIVACEYIFGRIPRGTFDWNKFVPSHEVQRTLENYGFEVKSIVGVSFNPLTKRFSWSTNTLTLYGLHAIKQKEL